MTETTITRISLNDPNRPKGRIRADAPEGPDEEPGFWDDARVVAPHAVLVPLDPETAAFFDAGGEGAAERMAEVLRRFAAENKAA